MNTHLILRYAVREILGLVVPILLTSWWTGIASVLNVVLLIFRTALEDRTLQSELEGYADFAQQVRYRLMPGVW